MSDYQPYHNPLEAKAKEAMKEWSSTPEGQEFLRYEKQLIFQDKFYNNKRRLAPDDEEGADLFEYDMERRYSLLRDDPEEVALKKALFEKELAFIERVMKELSPRHRKVIKLHIYKNMSFSEIAPIFKVNRQRAWDIYHDAIFRIQARLEHFHKTGKYRDVDDKLVVTRANQLKKAWRSRFKDQDAKQD